MLPAFLYLSAYVHVHQYSLYTQKCCSNYHQGGGLTKAKTIRPRQVCTAPSSTSSESFFLFHLYVSSALPCVLTLGPVPGIFSLSCSHSRSLSSFFSSVQLLSCVWLFATPWTAAHQASLSITNSQSLLKLMSTVSVMPSYHLILCCPLLLPPSIFPSIKVFSNKSVL